MGSGFWPRLGALVGRQGGWGSFSGLGFGLQDRRGDLWRTGNIGLELSRKERNFEMERPLTGRGWGFRESLWDGTPESASEWEEPPTHLEEFLVGCKGWYWWGRKEKWLILGSLASFPALLWALKDWGWPQECTDMDATFQVPGSLWNLPHFDLSTSTSWPQRRAIQASPPNLETHLLNSGCHPAVFHLYCFFSLGPQLEGRRWDQEG